MEQCKGITQRGLQCKNPAKAGHEFCSKHLPKIENIVEIDISSEESDIDTGNNTKSPSTQPTITPGPQNVKNTATLEAECQGLVLNATRKIVVLDDLARQLRRKQLSGAYTVKTRVKTEGRLFEKVMEKRENGKPDYAPTSATDLLGMRVVSLFRSEIPQHLDLLLRIILQKQNEVLSPFEPHVEETIIYVSGQKSERAKFTSDIKTVLKSFGLQPDDIQEKESSYSSVHLIVRLHDSKPENTTLLLPEDYAIPVEIQFREVFEDAWGEINHRLGYSLQRSATSIVKDDVSRSLIVLKAFTDGCASFSTNIADRASQPSEKQSPGPVKPFEFDLLSDLDDLPTKEKSAFKQADEMVKEAEELDEIDDSDKEKTQAAMRKAANAWLQAVKQVESLQNLDKYTKWKAILGGKLSAAYCYLQYGTRSSLKKAETLLLKLHKNNPDQVVVLQRLGQVYGKLNHHYLAIRYLESAVEILDDADKMTELWPPVEESTLRSTIPRLLSYQLWRDINSGVSSRESIIATCKRAYTLSLISLQASKDLDDDKRIVKDLNNAVFYSTRYLDEVRGMPLKEDEIDLNIALQHLSELEAKVDRKNIQWQIMDTLQYAYNVLKKSKDTELANRVIDAIWPGNELPVDTDVLQVIDVDERMALLRACKVLGLVARIYMKPSNRRAIVK